MHNFNVKKAQHGLTLIELLVALVLGVLILLSVSQGLVTLNSSNRTQSNNALLQETGDTALSYIAFELRSALSTPCDRFSTLNENKGRLTVRPLKGSISAENIPNVATENKLRKLITGVGVTVTTTNVGTVGNKSNVKTDNLRLISTGTRLFIDDDVNYNSTKVKVKGSFLAAANDTQTIYALTDCEYMDIFRATPSSLNNELTFFPAGTKITRRYAANTPSMVAPLNVTDITIEGGKLISKSQFVVIPPGDTPDPLLNNVELMRILFAVDKDGNDSPDSYITAKQVSTLPVGSRIISADIYLMVRLPNIDSAWQSSYKLSMPQTNQPIQTSGRPNTQIFTFTDRVPRKIFVRSVAIRNNSQML